MTEMPPMFKDERKLTNLNGEGATVLLLYDPINIRNAFDS